MFGVICFRWWWWVGGWQEASPPRGEPSTWARGGRHVSAWLSCQLHESPQAHHGAAPGCSKALQNERKDSVAARLANHQA